MSGKQDRLDKFRRELLSRHTQGRVYQSVAFIRSRLDGFDKAPELKLLLGLQSEHLSSNATRVLNLLESDDSKSETITFDDFKWKVLAYLTIQDIFDLPLFKVESKETMEKRFGQWYFYYEGKFALIELILCGLNGFYVANHALLRPFAEFNLLQN